MKKLIMGICSLIFLALICPVQTFANTESAIVVSVTEEKEILSDRSISTTTTEYEDGIIEIETLTVYMKNNNNLLKSTIEGTTDAEKTKVIKNSNGGVILDVTLYATFTWNSSQAVCVSKHTGKLLDKKWLVKTWDVESGYYHILGIKTGTAYADLTYYIYLAETNGLGYNEGVLTINCKKNGAIS